ncbi:hypothetical protein IWZ03DRAFT_143815 [Phyllosticta citriasiana]|uniref:Cryptic loci regulator 2 N-terminal domain-containing protein n=1 Tax=Phyllosticta citriasiana TaxID=595635 RepID=A0ABR1KT39_9PEZI
MATPYEPATQIEHVLGDFSDGDPGHVPPEGHGYVLVATPDHWLRALGEEYQRMAGLEGEDPRINGVPSGYTIWRKTRNDNKRRDYYLYGHPKGKRFDSPYMFAPHLFHLLAYRSTDICPCEGCCKNPPQTPRAGVRTAPRTPTRGAPTAPQTATTGAPTAPLPIANLQNLASGFEALSMSPQPRNLTTSFANFTTPPQQYTTPGQIAPQPHTISTQTAPQPRTMPGQTASRSRPKRGQTAPKSHTMPGQSAAQSHTMPGQSAPDPSAIPFGPALPPGFWGDMPPGAPHGPAWYDEEFEKRMKKLKPELHIYDTHMPGRKCKWCPPKSVTDYCTCCRRFFYVTAVDTTLPHYEKK